MTGVDSPVSLSKFDLEKLVKQNGGSVFQSEKSQRHMCVIANRGIVKFSDLSLRRNNQGCRSKEARNPRYPQAEVATRFNQHGLCAPS